MSKLLLHVPTNKKCRIIECGGHNRIGQSLCDFGDHAFPFSWVLNHELRAIEDGPKFYFDRVSIGSTVSSFHGLTRFESIERFWFDNYDEAKLACDRAFVAALPHERVTILTCL